MAERVVMAIGFCLLAVAGYSAEKPLVDVTGELTDEGAVVCWLPNRFPRDWSGMIVKRRKLPIGSWQPLNKKPIALCCTKDIDWPTAVPSSAMQKKLMELLQHRQKTGEGLMRIPGMELTWGPFRGPFRREDLDQDGAEVAFGLLIQSSPINSVFVGLGCFDDGSTWGKDRYVYGVFPVLGGKTASEPVGIWNPYIDRKSPRLALDVRASTNGTGHLVLHWATPQEVLSDFSIRSYAVFWRGNGKQEYEKIRVVGIEEAASKDGKLFFAVGLSRKFVLPDRDCTLRVVPGDVIERYDMRPTTFEYKPVKKK